jgi:dipeptidyl-peptidase 4
MRRTDFLCVITLIAALDAALVASDSKNPITLEQTLGRGGDRLEFASRAKSYSFDAEGALIEGRGGKRLDPKTLDELPAAPDEKKSTVDTKALATTAKAALDAHEGIETDAAERIVENAKPAVYGARGAVFFSNGGVYFASLGSDKAARVLIETGGAPPELVHTFTQSGDMKLAAFVRANDLYVVRVDTGVVRRITDTGSPTLLNGKLDWVYQEEVYGRGNFFGYFASPDGRTIAFLTLDESPVMDFPIVDPIVKGHFRGDLEVMKYPKAGDPNPLVKLSIADLDTGRVIEVDLAQYQSIEPIVADVHFTLDSKHCLAVIQDRRQTEADLIAIDVANGQWKPWIHESSQSWVDRPERPHWLADGSFLWHSQRTGYQHLYRYGADGKLMNAVTTGDFSLASLVAVDDTASEVWWMGKGEGPATRDLYRSKLDGSATKRLTKDRGVHSIQLSPDKKFFVDSFSNLTTPTKVRLCDRDGKVLHELDEAKVTATAPLAPWKHLAVKARDGHPLDAAILLPLDRKGSEKTPLWISTYSGPDAPTLQDRWQPSAWHQFLAQNGVAVMQVNVRSASATGRVTAATCYRRLGKQELADLEDAIDHVVKHDKIDPRRVGITGYSYGGFMTAYAMTKSKRFALGIAGGGVYDWRMYDTIYTERYMDLPANNKDGYLESSVIESAEDLEGHLLIHHGVDDDNVHLQNALQLAYALQKAGKSFEFMPYPETGHGIGDPDLNWHFRQLEWRLIQKYLVSTKTL